MMTFDALEEKAFRKQCGKRRQEDHDGAISLTGVLGSKG